MEIPVNPIPENFKVIDAAVTIKAMDEEGTICVFHRFTEGMNDHEALGRVISMGDILRNQILCQYVSSGEEDEEEDEDS